MKGYSEAPLLTEGRILEVQDTLPPVTLASRQVYAALSNAGLLGLVDRSNYTAELPDADTEETDGPRSPIITEDSSLHVQTARWEDK